MTRMGPQRRFNSSMCVNEVYYTSVLFFYFLIYGDNIVYSVRLKTRAIFDRATRE